MVFALVNDISAVFFGCILASMWVAPCSCKGQALTTYLRHSFYGVTSIQTYVYFQGSQGDRVIYKLTVSGTCPSGISSCPWYTVPWSVRLAMVGARFCTHQNLIEHSTSEGFWTPSKLSLWCILCTVLGLWLRCHIEHFSQIGMLSLSSVAYALLTSKTMHPGDHQCVHQFGRHGIYPDLLYWSCSSLSA